MMSFVTNMVMSADHNFSLNANKKKFYFIYEDIFVFICRSIHIVSSICCTTCMRYISIFVVVNECVCVCACVLFPYSFLSCPPSLTKLCCCLTFFPPECSCIFDSTKSRACIIWINQVDYATTYNNNKNKTPIKMNRLHL